MDLKDLIKQAESGGHLWMSELRKEFDVYSNEKLVLKAVLFDCTTRDLELRLPRPEDEREEEFLRDYTARNIFNILSVLGGQSMSLYYRRDLEWLDRLVRSAVSLVKEHPGYSKVISINNNMASALGFGRFYFSMIDLRALEPASEAGSEPYEFLSQKLRKAAQTACKGLYLGLDVGGSDIKLAAAEDGRITELREYDWDPESFTEAGMLTGPILKLAGEAARGRLFDAIGVSFPDICCGDRIVGGETPKTRGIREAHPDSYREQLAEISALADGLRRFAKPGAPVRIINDGHMSAFTAAVEYAEAGEADLSRGIVAHSLGTDLGFGMIDSRGAIADMPQEFYDIYLDMGDLPSAAIPAADIRSTCNENTGLPDARRLMGQSAAFRLAMSRGIAGMNLFTDSRDGIVTIAKKPDMRKPCLEALMIRAQDSAAPEAEIFREIGRNLGMMSREMDFLLAPATDRRLVFGRFVKRREVFELIKQGCAETAPFIELEAGDESLANTPLMKELAASPKYTVAQFGQAVGAVYYAVFAGGADDSVLPLFS
ncbi:MAG: ROK family protein [Firmicutes bacterium]|nr:ROK family protein [Bacillota bacterium]